MLTSSFCKTASCFVFSCFGLVPAAFAAEAPAPQHEAEVASPVASNERISTLDGSKSAWSGQFQATYSGSSLKHPLSGETPNPGHFVPPPVVLLNGTVSARYRFDPATTAGLGTGLGTEQPLQGPKHTRASDPYVDIARSFSLGPIRNRIDAAAKVYTSHQYRTVFGYREGVTLLYDAYYEATQAFTLGLIFNGFYNTFTGGDYDRRQQVGSQFFFIPTAEYRLNRTFNIRFECQIVEMNLRSMRSPTGYKHNEEFNRLGLGMAATRDLYFYLFAKFFPYTSKPVTADNTLIGLTTIVNLF